jgi:DNA-directed RNA polymerase subunit E'/Rpb7
MEENIPNTPKVRFEANPHALFKDGVCIAVVYMQDYGPEKIAESLANYEYDKVIRYEDYGWEIYEGQVEDVDAEGLFYSFPPDFPSWVWWRDAQRWMPPVEHPWDKARRTIEDFHHIYIWDEDKRDWVIESTPPQTSFYE